MKRIVKNWEKFNEDLYVPDTKTSTSTSDKRFYDDEDIQNHKPEITPMSNEETTRFWERIIGSLEEVTNYLSKGGDPNFGKGLPIRLAIKGSYKYPERVLGSDGKPIKGNFKTTDRDMGEGYFDTFKILVDNGANINAQVLKHAAEYGRLDMIDYMVDNGLKTGFKEAIEWLKHSRKIPEKLNTEVINYLKKIVEETPFLG